MQVNELHASYYLQPVDIAKSHENIIKERHKAMNLRLLFRSKDTRWLSQEGLEMFAEEGRSWAEETLNAIQFLARRCEKTPGSFFKNEASKYQNTNVLVDIVETCERCLKRLSPEVFFNGGATSSPNMTC